LIAVVGFEIAFVSGISFGLKFQVSPHA